MYPVMDTGFIRTRLKDEIMNKIYAFCPLALNGHLHCFHSMCIPSCCACLHILLSSVAKCFVFLFTVMFNHGSPDS